MGQFDEKYNEIMEQVTGNGQGKGNPEQGTGGTDKCHCPECHKEFEHERGMPCNKQKCDDCNVELTGVEPEK